MRECDDPGGGERCHETTLPKRGGRPVDHVDARRATDQLSTSEAPLDFSFGHPVVEQLPKRDNTVLGSAEPADEAL